MRAPLPHHPAAPASGVVWKMLFDRQQALLHRWVGPDFGRALAELGLRRDALPNLGHIGQVVRQRTGWTLAPVYSSMSLHWLLENDADLRRRANDFRDLWLSAIRQAT